MYVLQFGSNDLVNKWVNNKQRSTMFVWQFIYWRLRHLTIRRLVVYIIHIKISNIIKTILKPYDC